MRGIILTKSGNIHVTSNLPIYQDGVVTASLATGGVVQIPIDNVESTETYTDNQIETFRLRLKELRG